MSVRVTKIGFTPKGNQDKLTELPPFEGTINEYFKQIDIVRVDLMDFKYSIIGC